MTHAPSLPDDPLAPLVPPEDQRQAARMAHDAFARLFRLSVEGKPAALAAGVAELEIGCREWCSAAGSEEARALRQALLASGIDQWALAYSQAFELTQLPGPSALLGALRAGLDVVADARFQQQFESVEREEMHAIDFKVELRRAIHLALWHAMAACDDRAEAARIMRGLGGMMLALIERMPLVGWRLVADALAHVQIRLLSQNAPLPQETTQRLFESLRLSLPAQRHREILAAAGQAVLAWQQARRPN
ncbi:hypothetical protein [Sulfurisoma sediminicola]|uniref:Uncharacterized protein n=2 Tax=Sulfurisoma sediminicola TaxID=1381557 RepID=A0A497XD12_9PROT|nr:hypothetical protein [Sulfurisoma sediminicola]RLJ64841.1 hypothetical protein DFR35_1489 [Sulfurisoma sediminicola]